MLQLNISSIASTVTALLLVALIMKAVAISDNVAKILERQETQERQIKANRAAIEEMRGVIFKPSVMQ